MPAVREEGVITVTSKPYPHIYIESMDVTHTFSGGRMSFTPELVEELSVAHALTSAELRDRLQTYTLAEELTSTHALASGDLKQVLKAFSDWPAEEVNTTHAFTAGDLKRVLIGYPDWVAEELNVTHAFTSGTIT